MEYVGLLAPIAFVFALAALAQIGALRKELNRVKEELAAVKKKTEESSPHNSISSSGR